jgi:hypothetical protein
MGLRAQKVIQEKKEAELSNPIQFQSSEAQSMHFYKIFKDNYGKDLSQLELESEQLPGPFKSIYFYSGIHFHI